MYIDKEHEFSDAQAVTTAEATDSTNTIDLGAAGDADSELFLVVQVDTTVSSTGNATVTFALQTSAAADFDPATTLWQSAAIAKATLVAGYEVAKLRLPRGLKRYLKLVITPAVEALNAGKFTAFLTPNIDTNS